MEFLSHIDLRLIFGVLHVFGVIIAAGGAFFSDFLFLAVTKDGKITKDEFSLLKHADSIVWAGLFVAIPSGVGLFAPVADIYLTNSAFLAKMTIFAVLLVNGVFFHIYHLPQLKILVGKSVFNSDNKLVRDSHLVVSGVVSVVSWVFVIFLGAMVHVPFGYFFVMLTYLASIIIGFLIVSKIAQPIIDKRERKVIKKDALIVAVLLVVFAIMAGRFGGLKINAVSVSNTEIPEEGVFTMAEVKKHATPDDCWIVIDQLVFDMTKASKTHPAAFPNCGGDATENYFKNHAPSKVIRDKQMVFLIGRIGSKTTDNIAITGPRIPNECELDDRPGDKTNPETELFVEVGSWKTEDMMIVIEKHCRSLLFIDGETHEAIGRIHDIGHQMHAPTVSNDTKFLYSVARDGVISKVDLKTLETIAQTKIGLDSRGTGLTDDGKYLLVGNFEPHTAVLLDAKTLKILKEYEIETTLNGKPITSRVGGIAQLGSKLYVVIKDANQVWVIDTEKEGFPVVKKYEDLGQKNGVTTPPLHDIYITPDGKYVIAAVQDAAVAWVLNAETGEVVAEVPTGKTPHTGPGATVGDLTFVPTLDDSGIISVINTKTWKNIMDIDIGGPSLFIRHNPTAESAEEYPYIWGETAFGDRHDEIYLINLNWVLEGKEDPIEYTLTPVPGESSWHPEFTMSGDFVYVVSMTGNQVVVYDAKTIEVVARIQSGTPSSVINVGSRAYEYGL